MSILVSVTFDQLPPSPSTDIMELKRMMEKLGQAKTHLELKKMIAEVDTNNSGDGGKVHACVILALFSDTILPDT